MGLIRLVILKGNFIEGQIGFKLYGHYFQGYLGFQLVIWVRNQIDLEDLVFARFATMNEQ